MIRLTLASALLVFTAVASAQTRSVELPLAALRGYRVTGGGEGIFPFVQSLYTSAKFTPGTFNGPATGNTLTHIGWRSEFDLSVLPPGARLLSAIFETQVTQVSISGSQTDLLKAYAGTGTVSARPVSKLVKSFVAGAGTTLRVDVTSFLGAGRYPGFDLYAQDLASDGSTNNLFWSTPKLTVTFTPVPEPAAFLSLGLSAPAPLRRRGTRR